jgi:hypothetical protein
MSPHWSCLLLVILTFNPTIVFAQFTGNLQLIPKGCQTTGQCTLGESLRFKDSAGLVWEAAAGLVTDGASIPAVFQPFIGTPFDEKFIKAAIIHDHYCRQKVRSWRVTHRGFYEALLNQGVSVAKAKTMYLGVLVGSDKWIRSRPGNHCGTNCINTIKLTTGGTGYRYRRADFSLPTLPPALQEVHSQLLGDPESLSLEQLEARARQLRPGDFYFENGDEIVVSDSDSHPTE